MTRLQIEIIYEQPLEILIEFPVAVLASYAGSSKLDETLDDNILYLITSALGKHQLPIKKATLTVEQKSKQAPSRIYYRLVVIAKPPLFDFNWLIAALSEAGFQRGMHLKLARKNGDFESRYQDASA